MTVVVGGSKCNLITGYTTGEDNQVNYGRHKWLAQTFTLDELNVVWRCRCKSWIWGSSNFYHYALRNTDGVGKPAGADIAHTTLSPLNESWHPPGKWRRFDFGGFPNLPAGVYALIFSVPDSTDTWSHRLRCDATASAYPLGKAWESNNSGATWDEIPNTDFMFEVWGWEPPPVADPAPTISNWAPLSNVITFVNDTATIVITTDIPIHLFMRWTETEPLTHPTELVRRGISLPNATRFCFVNWHENEQEEPGDTLTHTFTKPNWPVCQTRYFYFLGTKQVEESPSASPIFKHHHAPYVWPEGFFAYEPDKCVVLASGAWVKVTHLLGGFLKDLLPPNAVVAFLQTVNRGNADNIGLRPVDSTHNEFDWQNLTSHQWAPVALDSDNNFEIYLTNRLQWDIWLMGYATSDAVVMFPDPIDKTPLAGNAWIEIDLSVECPNAIGILSEVIRDGVSDPSGIRKHNSTDNRLTDMRHDWPIIGCDSAQKIDFYPAQIGPIIGKLYITGYIKQFASLHTNAPDESLGIITSYQTITLAPGPSLAFLEVFAPLVAADMALRAVGSALDLFYEPNWRHTWAIVPLNAEGKFEGKIESLDTDWFLIGSGSNNE